MSDFLIEFLSVLLYNLTKEAKIHRTGSGGLNCRKQTFVIDKG
ncbi:hypothetical protein CLOSTHATH_04997 [Hungatella hathewayi DSM 13479]|uniref:Uncharacterized protein n=1 Tax=Hungatella hathewayi DSM 13479 TaxID=566550 RepID=D3AMZ7_9FIRM|nr:hypothetical protein CLOSTHATH_04997 [Hungatella hathewayi DSM 13479]